MHLFANTSISDIRAMMKLALPIILVQVGTMSMGVVDTMMVGRVSAGALAAVGLGSIYFFSISVLGTGILMSLDPVISQAFGAGDRLAISRAVQRGLVLAVFLGIPASLLLIPVEAALFALRQPAEVIPDATRYLHASIAGLFPFLAFVVLRQSLQAMYRMSPIVWTIVLANAANVVFNWLFVFGNLGFPAMGAAGAGWASSASRWLMAIMLAIFGWRSLREFIFPLIPGAISFAPLVRMLRLGTPIGIQFFLEVGAFSLIGLLMGWIGAVEMASHQVAINLASLTFMVPLGMASAAAVLVGHAVGRGDPVKARTFAVSALASGAIFMAVSALFMLAIPGVLARAYTADIAVLAVAVTLIPIAGVFQVFDGIQVVAIGVLRGVGDTRTPMFVNLLGYWGLGLPLSGFLAFGLGLGATGLWWGLVMGLAVVSAILLLRVRFRLGKELPRVVIDETSAGAAGVDVQPV